MNKKTLWYVLLAIVAVGVVMSLKADKNAGMGSATLYDAIYPPADPYAGYVPPTTDYIYPPADPIYPPTADYIYPPTDPIYPPTGYIYPPTTPIYPPIYPPY